MSNTNITILLSGRGSNFRAINKAIEQKKIKNASIVAVISNKPYAEGLSYAKDNNIETFVLDPKMYPTREKFDEEVLRITQSFDTGLICLASVGESSISYTQMIYLNFASFVTMFAFAGICFLTSAWFNRSKYAMAVGGGLSMYFVVATIMGLFGSPEMPSLIRMDSMNVFNFTTITGLFDGASIFADTLDFVPKLAVLSAIGLAGFVIGILRFDKKDLPL